eukprot:4691412-Amphidinium_carterae.1
MQVLLAPSAPFNAVVTGGTIFDNVIITDEKEEADKFAAKWSERRDALVLETSGKKLVEPPPESWCKAAKSRRVLKRTKCPLSSWAAYTESTSHL